MRSRRDGQATAAALKRPVATSALVLLVALSTPGAVAADASETRPRRTAGLLSRYERDVVRLVNATRSRYGRVALVPSSGLTAAAQAHTLSMVRRGFFEHEAPGAPAFWRRIERFYPSAGYGYWAVGENLAYGSPSLEPAEAVAEWLASPPHRRNLIGPEWREVGLAAVHTAFAPGEFEGEPATVVTLDLGARRR